MPTIFGKIGRRPIFPKEIAPQHRLPWHFWLGLGVGGQSSFSDLALVRPFAGVGVHGDSNPSPNGVPLIFDLTKPNETYVKRMHKTRPEDR